MAQPFVGAIVVAEQPVAGAGNKIAKSYNEVTSGSAYCIVGKKQIRLHIRQRFRSAGISALTSAGIAGGQGHINAGASDVGKGPATA
jgi:hypothetical protein